MEKRFSKPTKLCRDFSTSVLLEKREYMEKEMMSEDTSR
jgi:hypothetical protein